MNINLYDTDWESRREVTNSQRTRTLSTMTSATTVSLNIDNVWVCVARWPVVLRFCWLLNYSLKKDVKDLYNAHAEWRTFNKKLLFRFGFRANFYKIRSEWVRTSFNLVLHVVHLLQSQMSSLASYDCTSDSSDNSTVHIPGAGVFTRERDKENHVTGSGEILHLLYFLHHLK